MAEIYISLMEAADLEATDYEIIKKRVQRNPEKYQLKKEKTECGGKDLSMIALSSKAENLMIAGCAMKPVDNTGGEDGAVEVQVRRGAFVWNNDGSIKATDVMKPCYVSDAQTVTITSTGSSKAGVILGIEGDGVIVETL